MVIQDQPDYKRLYGEEVARSRMLEEQRDRVLAELKKVTKLLSDHCEFVREMREKSRETTLSLRFSNRCPLCYQIGEHTADCPSRK